MEYLVIGVVALIAIAFATVVSPRVGIASPLILVAIGIGASALPGVGPVAVDPEVILAGVLPPLLYAAGVSIPATDFRREFKSIGALSVVLTIISTLLLGVLFHAVLPDLAWPWAFALGAIVSPSDPVATSIIKRLGVAPRMVSLLEGESLLNDATALVLLRGAVAAAASAVTIWGVAWEFILAMTVAVIIGWLVGHLNLIISARITDTTANTVFTFTVPFLASIPAELMGASGLVAAVVAGLVTGNGAARALPPQVRASDHQTWRAIELMLEGVVYLILGLELFTTVEAVHRDHQGAGFAVGVAAVALLAVLVVRAAFIAPLLWFQARRAARAVAARPRIADARAALNDDGTHTGAIRRLAKRRPWHRRLRPSQHPTAEAVERYLTRAEADISYLERAPLGPREGGLMVWAGMRGVVTVAAAQTLPLDAPDRDLLVLIAYIVAIGSLVVQGGTIAWAVRVLKPSMGATEAEQAEERARLRELLDDVGAEAREEFHGAGRDGHHHAQHLHVIEAKRDALLDVRSLGTFSSPALSAMLAELDAEQIRLEL
ncbi:sodium:proton antiporter [Demequina sp. NBRC 110053]|uniref:cation:proton antiporter n=1 Tax=Demequina sp. NBRC 110053 TaxID=1570342 RepID=UPI000A073E5E|nr:sodium:proton antiporter [Demequina sp. NBRC 110053]